MDTHTIRNFYKDQTVFITGGTGFLGKLLVEKLLRSCQPFRIYVLVRAKKGKSPKQRFDDFFSFPCFDRIKSEQTDTKSKIVFVEGDCEKPQLGLTEEGIRMLLQETTTVIHAAADVKFDRPLKHAANITVRATKDLLDLALQMANLKAFVYVSTAFSNCPQSVVEEEIYTPPISWKALLEIADCMDDEHLSTITPHLLGEWPNTYTFTKCIAESLVDSYKGDLPIVLVRPAIVTSTIEEPMPGWVDNFYGVVGIVAAVGLGVIRSVNAKGTCTANLIPCDYAVNIILASAWKVNLDKTKNTTVYNFACFCKNSLTWHRYMKILLRWMWDFPLDKMVWFLVFDLRENKYWHKTYIFFTHTMVAHLADLVLLCIGRKPLAVQNYARIDKLLDMLAYFTTRSWIFRQGNVTKLWDRIGQEEKETFKFYTSECDWDDYLKNTIMNGRVYLLKDPLDTIPKSIRKLKILMIAHYTVVGIFLLLLYLFCSKMVNVILSVY